MRKHVFDLHNTKQGRIRHTGVDSYDERYDFGMMFLLFTTFDSF